MRFFKLRIEKAEYVDALEEIEYRFGCFLCTVTGGLLSKTNYPLEVMVSHTNDYQQKICDECREEQQGKWKEHYLNGVWHYDCPFCDDGYASNERQEHPENYCSNCGARLHGAEADDR